MLSYLRNKEGRSVLPSSLSEKGNNFYLLIIIECERVLRSHFNFLWEVFFISKEAQQINNEIKDKEFVLA